MKSAPNTRSTGKAPTPVRQESWLRRQRSSIAGAAVVGAVLSLTYCQQQEQGNDNALATAVAEQGLLQGTSATPAPAETAPPATSPAPAESTPSATAQPLPTVEPIPEVLPWADNYLARGDKDTKNTNDVYDLQVDLGIVGCLPNSKADGVFGGGTESGVKLYESFKGETQDGRAGRELAGMLRRDAAAGVIICVEETIPEPNAMAQA